MKTFQQYIEEGANDPDIFKVIFFAGGPGSGKSYVVDNTTRGSGLVVSNSDELLKIGMGKAGLSLKMPDNEAEQKDAVRAKAKDLTAKRLKTWIEGRLGIVIDSTGNDFDDIKRQRNDFISLGYDTYMIFVNTSLEIALERNEQRQRTLPKDIVEKYWKNAQKNLGAFQRLFGSDSFIIVDNNSADASDLKKVWMMVRKFLKKPIKNQKALQWIKDQKNKVSVR